MPLTFERDVITTYSEDSEYVWDVVGNNDVPLIGTRYVEGELFNRYAWTDITGARHDHIPTDPLIYVLGVSEAGNTVLVHRAVDGFALMKLEAGLPTTFFTGGHVAGLPVPRPIDDHFNVIDVGGLRVHTVTTNGFEITGDSSIALSGDVVPNPPSSIYWDGERAILISNVNGIYRIDVSTGVSTYIGQLPADVEVFGARDGVLFGAVDVFEPGGATQLVAYSGNELLKSSPWPASELEPSFFSFPFLPFVLGRPVSDRTLVYAYRIGGVADSNEFWTGFRGTSEIP